MENIKINYMGREGKKKEIPCRVGNCLTEGGRGEAGGTMEV